MAFEDVEQALRIQVSQPLGKTGEDPTSRTWAPSLLIGFLMPVSREIPGSTLSKPRYLRKPELFQVVHDHCSRYVMRIYAAAAWAAEAEVSAFCLRIRIFGPACGHPTSMALNFVAPLHPREPKQAQTLLAAREKARLAKMGPPQRSSCLIDSQLQKAHSLRLWEGGHVLINEYLYKRGLLNASKGTLPTSKKEMGLPSPVMPRLTCEAGRSATVQ